MRPCLYQLAAVLAFPHESVSGIEYWQIGDPASKDNVLQCSADGEDPSCSASIPSQGINSAHMSVRVSFLLNLHHFTFNKLLVFRNHGYDTILLVMLYPL